MKMSLIKKNEDRLIRQKFFPDSTENISEEDRNYIKANLPEKTDEKKLKIF